MLFHNILLTGFPAINHVCAVIVCCSRITKRGEWKSLPTTECGEISYDQSFHFTECGTWLRSAFKRKRNFQVYFWIRTTIVAFISRNIPIYSKTLVTMTIPDDVDIIVCGGRVYIKSPGNSTTDREIGGSAGCVVAGRLANIDRNLKVLLIEGGENNLNNPWVYR